MFIQIILYTLFTLLGFFLGCLIASNHDGNRVKDAITTIAKDGRPVMVDGQLYKISEVTK